LRRSRALSLVISPGLIISPGFIIMPAHLIHVVLRLPVRRDPFVLVDCARPRIVCSQREPVVLVETLKVLQILDACFDILARIEAVVHAEHTGRRRSQLHQPFGTLGRNGIRIVIALHFDHGMDQKRVHVIGASRLIHHRRNAGRNWCLRDRSRSRRHNDAANQTSGAGICPNHHLRQRRSCLRRQGLDRQGLERRRLSGRYVGGLQSLRGRGFPSSRGGGGHGSECH